MSYKNNVIFFSPRNYLLEREAAQKAGGPVDLDTLKLLSQLNPVRMSGGAKEVNQVLI